MRRTGKSEPRFVRPAQRGSLVSHFWGDRWAGQFQHGPLRLPSEPGRLSCGPKSPPRIPRRSPNGGGRSWPGWDAKSGVTNDEAKTFAEQTVAALVAVVKTGSALPSELKKPDFDALRRRADFQKLFAAVEAKAGPKAKPKD